MNPRSEQTLSLFLIPAPIGGPITEMSVNSLKILRETPNVFVETRGRVVRALFRKKILTSKHNILPMDDSTVEGDISSIQKMIQRQEDIAILADSGIPCFVDPGYHIVRYVLDHHLDTVGLQPVGVSSALDAALSMAGLDIQRFVFLGHYPECYDLCVAAGHRYPVVAYVAGRGWERFVSELTMSFPHFTRIHVFSNIRDRSNHRVTWWRRGEEGKVHSGPQDNHVVVIERD